MGKAIHRHRQITFRHLERLSVSWTFNKPPRAGIAGLDLHIGMVSPAVSSAKKFPIAALVAGVAVLIAIAGALLYFNRAVPPGQSSGGATPEAKAYVSKLDLSDISMKATENFMKQQVIEIEGKITNKGDRALQSIDVYCIFYSVNGNEIHRERLAIVRSKTSVLRPGETRPFRLPFDSLPDGWNQALPRMVIAQISFAS